MFGAGGKFFGAKTPQTAAPTVTAANDGASLTGTTLKLGQAVDAVGNPAKLLENREIPFNGFQLLLDQIGSASGVLLALQYAVAPGINPQIVFQSSTGAEIGRIRFDTQVDTSIYFGRQA